MKTFLFLALLALPIAAHAQLPPSPDAVRDWAGFPPDVTLTAERVSDEEVARNVAMWGTPKWMTSYANPGVAGASFSVGVFAPGTLWGTKRDLLVGNVEGQNQQGGSVGHVEFRPDGRKAYFTVLGSMNGATTLVGFTFLPKFDLLVIERMGAPDPKLKAPTQTLSQVLLRVEGSLLSQ